MYGKQKCKLNGSLNGTQSIYVHSLAEKLGPKNFLMKIFKISSMKKFWVTVIQPLHSQLLEAPKDGNSRSRSISGVSMRPIVSPGSWF